MVALCVSVAGYCQQEGETDTEDHRQGRGDKDCDPQKLATNEGEGNDPSSGVGEDGTYSKHKKRLVEWEEDAVPVAQHRHKDGKPTGHLNKPPKDHG